MRVFAAACFATLSLMSISALGADYDQMTGKALYRRFCASCHGVEGRGDGPVAGSLKVEVPNLTLIARRARGVYPRDRIARVIDGSHVVAAHGTRTMPIWGQEFNRWAQDQKVSKADARMIIVRLADYVWLLQTPATRDEDGQ